jgi:hypothetical protein
MTMFSSTDRPSQAAMRELLSRVWVDGWALTSGETGPAAEGA